MKVLVTGHRGYIGVVLAARLADRGHQVHGLDTGLYEGCDLGTVPSPLPTVGTDVRDVAPADLDGFDAVVHLAAISNDPLGQLRPQTTYDINQHASVHLAQTAKEAGVPRFVFASSCSLYGAAGDAPVTETADFHPVTPYGESKVLAEQGISKLADDTFSPTYMRNATAYGASPRLRGDIVVNNLTGYAFTTGEVRLQSDGTPWRPLVHIQDISGAVEAVLDAPREVVHDEAFNVGRDEDNVQIRDVALAVQDIVPNSRVTFAEGASADKRDYRVDFTKITERLPGFRPAWTVRTGIEELLAAFQRDGLTLGDLTGPRYTRLARVNELLASGRIDTELRLTEGAL